jgi:hypothetical protein
MKNGGKGKGKGKAPQEHTTYIHTCTDRQTISRQPPPPADTEERATRIQAADRGGIEGARDRASARVPGYAARRDFTIDYAYDPVEHS